jgi:hypothetical protein
MTTLTDEETRAVACFVLATKPLAELLQALLIDQRELTRSINAQVTSLAALQMTIDAIAKRLGVDIPEVRDRAN